MNSVRTFKLTELYQPTYNPRGYFLGRKDEGKRRSEDRVAFMLDGLPLGEINSYLDVGSQLGYFVFRMAENGVVSHGIEIDLVSHQYASALSVLAGSSRTSFQHAGLTSMISRQLPRYDAISFLNVFHHIVHADGFEEADRIVKALAGRCRYFVFETGGFGEKGQHWTDALAFMGDDPLSWQQAYLERDVGCCIMKLRAFKNHLNDELRSVFICKSGGE